jgi:hypothetical protein
MHVQMQMVLRTQHSASKHVLSSVGCTSQSLQLTTLVSSPMRAIVARSINFHANFSGKTFKQQQQQQGVSN